MELRGVEEVDGRVELEDDLKPATRLAVDEGIAATCIGGRLTSLAFLGSVDDNVCNTFRNIPAKYRGEPTFPRFLPMRTEMRLSLRSFSSFFNFDLSAFSFSFCFDLLRSRSESLPVSLLSPPWRLFLELEPLSKEGMPRLNMEDFRFVLGVDKEEVLGSSAEGDEPDFGKAAQVPEYDADEVVGDVEFGMALEGKWIDCDDERRKKGMEEGVRRFDDVVPWCTEEVGLNGAGGGSDVVLVRAPAEDSILFG